MTYLSQIHEPRGYTVYVRDYWSDTWTEQPYLAVDWVSWNSAPSLPSAGLFWKYAEGIQFGASTFAEIAPLDLLDKVVKIVFDSETAETDVRIFYGYVQDVGDNQSISASRPATDPKPHVPATTATYQSGEQSFVAYGLEIFLARQVVSGCWCQDPRRAADPGNRSEVKLGTALEPNQEHTGGGQGIASIKGNRSLDPGAKGTYLFSDSVHGDNAATWSTRALVEYLVAYHPILSNSKETTWINLSLDSTDADFLPNWDTPKIRLEGRSLKEIFDDLINRRSGLGWTLRYNEAIDKLVIHPFTYNSTPITTPGGNIIPPNSYTRTLDIDGRADCHSPIVKTSTAMRYDQVVVRGDGILCCGTMSALDGTLAPGWDTTALETEYEEAASEAADYDDLDLSIKQRRNAEYRAQDHLKRVYSHFNLPNSWIAVGAEVGDGEGGETTAPLFPTTDTVLLGELGFNDDTDAAWHLPNLRFERTIPLRTDHDYSGTNIADDTVTDSTPEGRSWTYRPPLVLLKFPDTEYGEDDRYGAVDRLAAASGTEDTGSGEGRKLNCSAQVQADAAGIILNVSGGQQHEIAATDFTPLGDDPDDLEQYDYTDNLIATIAMRSTQRVQKSWPESLEDGPTLDAARVLYIDLGPRAQLHYVAPNTVVGLSDGVLQYSTTGGYIRDDRAIMLELARMAFLWYGQERVALDLEFDFLVGAETRVNEAADGESGINIGDLITTFGSGDGAFEANSVVTEIRFDMAKSDSDTHKTIIRTQWAELDVLQVAGLEQRAVAVGDQVNPDRAKQGRGHVKLL